jgi:hypothetical protein
MRQLLHDALERANADPGHPANIHNFAQAEPVEFYRICARLLPLEISGTVTVNFEESVRALPVIEPPAIEGQAERVINE